MDYMISEFQIKFKKMITILLILLFPLVLTSCKDKDKAVEKEYEYTFDIEYNGSVLEPIVGRFEVCYYDYDGKRKGPWINLYNKDGIYIYGRGLTSAGYPKSYLFDNVFYFDADYESPDGDMCYDYNGPFIEKGTYYLTVAISKYANIDGERLFNMEEGWDPGVEQDRTIMVVIQ